MTDSTLTAAPVGATPAAAGPADVAELARLVPGFIQGARWFWWIAGFTAVNAALAVAHSDVNFVVGLAFTLLAHAGLPSGAALAVDALFVGFFLLMGLHAQKGRTWAFVLGALVYLVDALIYLKFADWMPVAIHAFALFYIVKAFMGLQAAKKATGLR